MYIGSWNIDDLLTFTVTTHSASTGALTDADSVPTYRVYEDETGTAILTGSMAKLDDTNTTGHYSEQLTLSAANGFEQGKSYNIYVTATVGAFAGGTTRAFQIRAASDVRAVGGNTTAPTNLATVYATDFAANYNTTLDQWNTNVESWDGFAVPAAASAGVPKVDLTRIEGATTVDTVTIASMFEALLAVIAGQATVAGSTISFKKRDGTTEKVSVTVGGTAGQRTASTIT